VRVAYFIQSHDGPAQLTRLVAAIRGGSPDAEILVGHCPHGPPADSAALAKLGAGLFAHRRRAERGSWSLLEPWFDAVERLAERGVAYDWLVYLSGQDYPIRPLPAIEDELAASDYDGYLRWRDARLPSREGRKRQGRLRYDYRWRELPRAAPLLRALRLLNGVQSLWHVHFTYGPRLGVRAFRSPLRGAFRPYVGLQWTTLRRACAEQVARVAREDAVLRDHFEHTICPDEAFAQTVLVNDGRFRLCNDPRRYTDFRNSADGRPRVLCMADLPALTGGGDHFARKFDCADDPYVLDWLDANVLAAPVADS
jgi:hypothetical protein